MAQIIAAFALAEQLLLCVESVTTIIITECDVSETKTFKWHHPTMYNYGNLQYINLDSFKPKGSILS